MGSEERFEWDHATRRNESQAFARACLGSSFGFMLPVSTPPNAIVYGSGLVPGRKMMRHGIVLDVAGWIAVVAVVMWLVPRVVR